VFIHGLWLLPSSWDPWATVFEETGYTALSPGWPDDPATADEAAAHPEVFAKKSIKQVADHFCDVIKGLEKKPGVVGHSFGGLLTQIIAARGLSAAPVAIDPAPFRGVLPLPISALKSSAPVLGNPANRAVPLTYDQFRFAFANVVSEEEAKQLYETYAVLAAGAPLFSAATANLIPWTEAKVDTRNPARGPLLISSRAGRTTPFPGRSPTRRTSARRGTRASRRSRRSPTAGTRSPSTAAGGRSRTRRLPSSSGSPRAGRLAPGRGLDPPG
jgi:pimeloyl-ACP methyl ester carboxylesterase